MGLVGEEKGFEQSCRYFLINCVVYRFGAVYALEHSIDFNA
jgi:hypothetical protein